MNHALKSRRDFIARLGMISAISAFPTLSFSQINLPDEFINTDTVYGKIRGKRIDGVNTFKGVPYGGKISGDRRFKRPAPLQPWDGVKDTLTLGAPAIQNPRRGEPEPSEDCLFLNVWTPANDSANRAVMFYSHGGGYVGGSGGSGGQDGANLARNFDVVVVETNHRLGLMGFLYLDEIAGAEYEGSGNMGVADIALGLKWVNENIANFGGDPNNVMIFGESGGGGKTSALYAMPEAAPYFNKASIESGPGVRMLTTSQASKTTALVLEELNIDPKDWKKLLEVPASKLLEVQSKIPFVPPFQNKEKGNQSDSPILGFGPVVDDVILPTHPFDPIAAKISKDKPLLVGWNEDEYTFFAWERKDTAPFSMDFDQITERLSGQFGEDAKKLVESYRHARPEATAPDIFVAISSINMMGLGSIEIAEKKAQEGAAPVYLYNFGYKSNMKIPGTDYEMGTPHAMDISFKFNNEVPPKDGETPRMGFGGSKVDRFEASRNFAELWTNFAKTGTPSANAPSWPAYNLQTRPTMRIDATCEVIENRFSEELATWRAIGKV
ncbi:carboxylesterase/lipase family protein [Algoriphagus aestuariicola]|uniref:Carboxylic ester hydrolase n=1 Tax=Algoriphagus aestuariicola TaxID=1852016 RepID=A0ABS3BPL9_9BACT|nr:carboxylesterase family protein [Algoriphagus aestuariicola]MBN7800265.1 carboxylesterase/lipase family protein [Algoriphagus aestuariicola]